MLLQSQFVILTNFNNCCKKKKLSQTLLIVLPSKMTGRKKKKSFVTGESMQMLYFNFLS